MITLDRIPDVFHSVETDAPFTSCADCGRALLVPDDEGRDVTYVIEKAMRRLRPYDARDVLFEYALCTDCYEAVHRTLSATSRHRLTSFFEEHVDLEARAQRLVGMGPRIRRPDPAGWLDRCMVTGRPLEELDEYQLLCACAGPRAVFAHLPCLISAEAAESMAALLSESTRDELRRFSDRITNLPPELAPLDPSPALLL